MNKLVIAIALCAALAACKKDDAAPADAAAPAADTAAPAADAMTPAADATAPAADATAPAADAMAPAADATAPAVASGSGLPKECEDYLNRAKACFAKANPTMAAAFQKSLDQSKASWETVTDKTMLAKQCVDANTQFGQAVAALKCE